MMALNVPATIGLIVLASPIIRVIFERRAFLPSDTDATAAALQFYAIGLVGYSIVRIASPAFYALGDSRTPVAISAAAVVVNATTNLALVRAWLLGTRARDVHRRSSTRARCSGCCTGGSTGSKDAG
jgi:putative peptidoglycan lipid II flippase